MKVKYRVKHIFGAKREIGPMKYSEVCHSLSRLILARLTKMTRRRNVARDRPPRRPLERGRFWIDLKSNYLCEKLNFHAAQNVFMQMKEKK